MENFFEKGRSPGEVLRALLDYKGWTQEELAIITNKSRKTILDIASDRSGISPDMALAFGVAFGTNPSDWLALNSAYRLSMANHSLEDVEKRATLFQMAPIRDMQRRGWIRDTKKVDELEAELKAFFSTSSLDTVPQLSVAPRRAYSIESLTPPQRSWCHRARQMATALTTKPFVHDRLRAAVKELRALAAYPKEARHLPRVLTEYGIRFVVVEPLPGAKIDGAAFWIDKETPVIAVSIRYDRIDAFWFTVMHEFSHIHHWDALSVDNELILETGRRDAPENESEKRADEDATSSLIPPDDFESFIRRVGPLYSKQRIIQFAHRIRIHPGIIVGQLQHRRELGYSALRDLLVKVRDVVTSTALTDGWNQTISPNLIEG
jgi:HTH-type transcriptional regulator / antitoxin HigA